MSSPPNYDEQLEQMGRVGHWALNEILRLRQENLGLKQQLEEALASAKKLTEQLETLQRETHRQAAPFGRPQTKRNSNPGKPGRKKGHKGAFRPKPQRIDEQVVVPLAACPHCQGPVCDKHPLVQYIEEIPEVHPTVTEVTTEEGWCPQCQQDVYSTHPLQTSRASGAAAVHMGPRALAVAVDLRSRGLSMRKTVAILRDLLGLSLTPGGLALLLQRVSKKVAPEYEQMPVILRQSEVVHADETGWWVGERGWWLWVFATPTLTYYHVIRSRARAVVQDILGADFDGTLVSDCLAIYDDVNDRQQKCYSHHLKAISLACEAHPQQGEGYLLKVQALLRTALLLKACQDPFPNPEFDLSFANLKTRTWDLLHGTRDNPQEEGIRKRLYKQRDHLFTFLKLPQVPATNNLGERQLRPGVITRKVSCGNKTPEGALAWASLSSIAATCYQNQRPFMPLIIEAVRLQPPRAP